ncbi:MAG: OB-fold domain-containing protein [Kiloniellales bacterium]
MIPHPEITEVNRAYWEGLAEGRLQFQRCSACDTAWLPPRAACPACLAPEPGWAVSSGQGRLVSWVVYRQAYADHLKERLPYNVAIVELDEGPRLLTNIIDSAEGEGFAVGARVSLALEEEEGLWLARFRLADREASS